MGLLSHIIAPAGLTLVRMEREGIPVDVERRDKLVARLEKEIAELEKQVGTFAQEWHTRRLAALAQARVTLKDMEELELGKSSVVPCSKHSTYDGLTKRAKCEECVRVYREAANLRETVVDLRKRAQKAKAKLKQLGEEFQSGSDDHWRWLLFEALKLVPVAFTEVKKLPRVKGEDIRELQAQYPDLPLLQWRVDLQHASHDAEALKVKVDVSGRTHTVFSQTRSETKRLTSGLVDDEEDKLRPSDAGNMQNVKDSLRQIFWSGSPDQYIITADWSQIELRGMAWKAGEVNLLRALREGKNIHTMNAAKIFACSIDQVKTKMVMFEGQLRSVYDASKRATHGWDYRMKAYKTGQMYKPWAGKTLEEAVAYLRSVYVMSDGNRGISPRTLERKLSAGDPQSLASIYEYANTERAQEWIDAYFEMWPRLRAFQEECIARVERDKYLTNSFGYRLRFHNFRFVKGRRIATDQEEIAAFISQSDVAIMSQALLSPIYCQPKPDLYQVARECGGALLLQVHDEFVARIPKSSAPEYIHRARLLLEREWPELGRKEEFGWFKVPAEFKVGLRWGKAHKHGENCDPLTCKQPENTDGVGSVKVGDA